MESNPKQGPHPKQVWMEEHQHIKALQNTTNHKLAELANEGAAVIDVQYEVGSASYSEDSATIETWHSVLILYYPAPTAEVR